ncbi:MAG: hypothetical protein OEN50_15625 [Deltaproteobacteria bacterium]|nr:hypothetical protein [Deltaproteobacteria bacterium]
MGHLCSANPVTVWFVAMGFLLLSCSVRDAQPVSLSNPTDSSLSCAQLGEQIVANERTALNLVGKQSEVENTNTALTAAHIVSGGGLLWVAVLDLSDVEKIEIAALHDRNKYLEGLRKSKNCTDEIVRTPQ